MWASSHCSYLVSYRTHAGVVDGPGVGGGSRDNDLGTEQRRTGLQGVIVNETGGLVEAVRHGLGRCGGGGEGENTKEASGLSKLSSNSTLSNLLLEP